MRSDSSKSRIDLVMMDGWKDEGALLRGTDEGALLRGTRGPSLVAVFVEEGSPRTPNGEQDDPKIEAFPRAHGPGELW